MKLAKLVTMFLDPRNWRALPHGVAPGVEHRKPLSPLKPAAVIDVGANKGQFSYLAHSMWPAAELYCFEPLPGPRAKLARLLGSDATIFDCALGETQGRAGMHVASREDSSSLLPLGRQRAIFSMEEVAVVEVPVERLDAVIPTDAPAPMLLKIDVQGFEYEVLKGATGLLDRIDWIYVEASFVELYEGQKLCDDVLALLEGHGYGLTGRHNESHHNGVLVQADLLFARSGGPAGKAA